MVPIAGADERKTAFSDAVVRSSDFTFSLELSLVLSTNCGDQFRICGQSVRSLQQQQDVQQQTVLLLHAREPEPRAHAAGGLLRPAAEWRLAGRPVRTGETEMQSCEGDPWGSLGADISSNLY